MPPPPPAKRAKIVSGVAIPPAGAPARVKRAIAAANRIIRKPYVYGGGHKLYNVADRVSRAKLDRGYDCSGTVSFALFGGRFLKSPLDSGTSCAGAARGKGRWITVYTNPGHAYVVIAGLRLDTSGRRPSTPNERRTRQRPALAQVPAARRAGFTARHPSATKSRSSVDGRRSPGVKWRCAAQVCGYPGLRSQATAKEPETRWP